MEIKVVYTKNHFSTVCLGYTAPVIVPKLAYGARDQERGRTRCKYCTVVHTVLSRTTHCPSDPITEPIFNMSESGMPVFMVSATTTYLCLCVHSKDQPGRIDGHSSLISHHSSICSLQLPVRQQPRSPYKEICAAAEVVAYGSA